MVGEGEDERCNESGADRALGVSGDTAAAEFDAAELGLCAGCRHRQLVRSRRSAFLRCALAVVDPAMPRYPRLPVAECRGFDASAATS